MGRNNKINDVTSNVFDISAGVPQGGVLSALLYIIYIADLPTPPPTIHRLQYADDMMVYTSVKNLVRGQHNLNAYIADIVTFFDRWKIKINPTKCESIVFKGPAKHFGSLANKLHNHVAVSINNTPLIPQKSIKYLGVIFSKNLSHIKHVNHVIAKVNRCYFSLRPVLKRVGGINTRIKTLIYKQLIRPIIMYGFPSWFNISSHQMERLRVIERSCLRACTDTFRKNTHKYAKNAVLYEKANIHRIDKELIHQTLKFFDHTFADCQLIQSCLSINVDHLNDVRTIYKPPWYIKHLQNENLLLVEDKLLLYHRRSFVTQRHGTVYNTDQ